MYISSASYWLFQSTGKLCNFSGRMLHLCLTRKDNLANFRAHKAGGNLRRVKGAEESEGHLKKAGRTLEKTNGSACFCFALVR